MKKFLFLMLIPTMVSAQQTINGLNIKGKLDVISTTKSSNPCPSMTEAQRDLIIVPATGSCVYNTNALSLNIYDGAEWKSAGGGGISLWLTLTDYKTDDVVIDSNKIYKSLSDHTSGVFATDLANGEWIELSAQDDLTGPISSTGTVTSITSQTGTGSKIVVDTSPVLVTPEIGAATGSSLKLSDKMISSYQTPDNMAKNGDVELTDVSMFTCGASNTCARTIASGEYSKGLAALKVSTTAVALDVSQTVLTPSGIQKQGYVRLLYKIPATITDAQICSLVDAAEQNCVPSNKLIANGLFNQIEIPLIFGTTSAGFKIKTTATYTQDVFIDNVILAQGLGTQNLMLDNVYSVKVSSAGVVSDENKDWISFTSVTDTSLYTYALSGFTAAPNCTAVINVNDATTNYNWTIVSVSSTQVQLRTRYTDTSYPVGIKYAVAHTLICQKSGNDYLNSSANVYSQASADYSDIPFTPTTTGLGTITAGNTCTKSRKGGDLIISCFFTTGTATPVLGSITLPDSLTLDSTRLGVSNTTAASGKYVGTSLQNGNAGSFIGVVTATGTATDKVYFAANTSGAAALVPANANATHYNTQPTSITFRVPISGWSNANSIIGSFAGVPAVPGYQGKVDTFSVSYGTGVATTVCSASPCSYLDQIGNAVSSMTRVGTGDYSLNLSKTYIRLKCDPSIQIAGLPRQVQCNNCNSVQVRASNTADTVFIDTAGTLMCQGTF